MKSFLFRQTLPIGMSFRQNIAKLFQPMAMPLGRDFCEFRSTSLISIEGNIGAGKSTLLSSLTEHNKTWQVVDEPVALWSTLKGDDGKSLLETFYEDTKRWSFTFQTVAALSRYESIENSVALANNTGTSILISERCLDTDYNVFAQKLFEDGSINSLEFASYKKYYEHLKRTATPLRGIIYIETPPNICLERIKQRGRRGEENITIEYLELLDQKTKKWIDSVDLPVLRLDDKSKHDFNKVESFISSFVSR